MSDLDNGFARLGIGNAINPQMKLEEQLSISGLNWSVVVSPLASEFQGKMIREDSIPVIRRGDTGEFLTVAGKNWKPYSNRRFLGDFNNFCNSAGYVIERAGFIKKNQGIRKDSFAFASALVPGSKGGELTLEGCDRSEMRIIFINNFKYGKGVGAYVMNERVFCQNQLVLRGRTNTRVLRHVSNHIEGTKGMINVQDTLESVRKTITNYWHVSQVLAQTQMNDREAMDFFINKFGDKDKPLDKQPMAVQMMLGIYFEEIELKNENIDLAMGTEATKNTAYGVLNAVTAYETHYMGYSRQTGRSALSQTDRFARRFDSDSAKAYDSLSRLYVPAKLRNQQEKQTVSVGL